MNERRKDLAKGYFPTYQSYSFMNVEGPVQNYFDNSFFSHAFICNCLQISVIAILVTKATTNPQRTLRSLDAFLCALRASFVPVVTLHFNSVASQRTKIGPKIFLTCGDNQEFRTVLK